MQQRQGVPQALSWKPALNHLQCITWPHPLRQCRSLLLSTRDRKVHCTHPASSEAVADPGTHPPATSAAGASSTAPQQSVPASPQPKSTHSSHSSQVWLPPPCDLEGGNPLARWNPVSLAFLGDAVWEAYLRSHLYGSGVTSGTAEYGSRVAAKANTQAQAACYSLLLKGGLLSSSEVDVMRWASNSSSVTPPKHATRQQYKQATAVEALVAYLYLVDGQRLHQVMDWLLEPDRAQQWRQPSSQTRKPPQPRQAAPHVQHGTRRCRQAGAKLKSSSSPGSSYMPASGDRL